MPAIALGLILVKPSVAFLSVCVLLHSVQPSGAMAPSVMLYMKIIITAYIHSHIGKIAASSPAVMTSSRATRSDDTLGPSEAFRLDDAEQLEHTVVGKQIYGINEYIPNTLSTTAHIHTLLFQPGSGAGGFGEP